jgi:hypothetical protein
VLLLKVEIQSVALKSRDTVCCSSKERYSLLLLKVEIQSVALKNRDTVCCF